MKKLSQLMMIVLIATIAIYAQIPTSGLVAWFPFSGDFQDKSESGIVMEAPTGYSPSFTADRNDVANSSAEFNGANQKIRCLSCTGLPTGNSDVTISAWIYTINGGIPRVIVNWGTDNVSHTKEISFYHTGIDGVLYLGLTNGIDSIVSRCPSGSSARWFHVAVVVKSGSAKFYMDGTPSNAQPINFNIQDNAIFSIADHMLNNNVGSNPYGGYIDDIAIYNRALTDNEITYIMNSTSVRNHAPAISSSPIITAKALVEYSYTISASDAENHTITISAPNKPAGMSLSGNKLTWTPTAADVGNHPITIVATDEIGDSSIQSFEITVAKEDPKNTPPVFTSTPVLDAKEGIEYVYDIKTSDAENESVTLSIPGKLSNMYLNGQKLVWTPTHDQVGEHNISIVATDESGDTSIQSFRITVEQSTSVTNKIVPQKMNIRTSDKIFYLPNGRVCSYKKISGMILSKKMKRMVIR